MGSSQRGTDSLEVRAAGPADEAAILALAERTLGWGPEDRWRDLFRWKHVENPAGASPQLVALAGDRVVGFRVMLRWRFVRPDGTTVEAVRAVDTATDPDFQGRGIFRRLTMAALDDLRSEGVGFVFNTPNDQSRPGYLKMGWVTLGRPPVAAFPTGLGGATRLVRARTAAKLWSEATDSGTDAPTALAGDGIESLVSNLAASDGLATDRTVAHLRWRYGLGDLHYRAIGLGGDVAEGAVVYRLRRRGPALEATVCEVLVPDSPDAGRRRRSLLRAVLRRSGADYALAADHRSHRGAPLLPMPGLGPLVTWRSVTEAEPVPLEGWRFGVGDLELF